MKNLESVLTRRFFPRVQRPGRYAGGELHSRTPDPDYTQIVLAFPDLYEIAFPYLGFQILYHLLNRLENVACQRVYAPAADAETILRGENIPLFTLEGKNPLSETDIIGFTLQYELHAVDILNMLDLAQIPLRSSHRTDNYPLIIAGGPLAYNPEPLSPFFDAFLIGDAEESLPEFVLKYQELKSFFAPRIEMLEQLSRLEGVYVPAFKHSKTIKARHLERLHPDLYPERPLVPLIAVEHDRLTLEIMRGCTRACRFCNAGFMHRPTRELPASDVVMLMEKGLKNTGWEEFSLLSLSTADYSQLGEVLSEANARLDDPGVTLSYPSLRPDAFTPHIASSIASGRKPSLTFAPEAGSERLRNSVNKDITDNDLLTALRIAREYGWNSAKLYFMIGLPQETDEDVEALISLAKKCREAIGASPRKPLHVSLSVFSPKPNTPFQRSAMLSQETIARRINLVKSSLFNRAFKISFHDSRMTALETILGRGDSSLAPVIEAVFTTGARLQGWSDNFNFPLWEDAMREHGLDWQELTSEIPQGKPLPWSHIQTGITPAFLEKEASRAAEFVLSPDCRIKCSKCGLQCPPPPKSKLIEQPLPEKKVRIQPTPVQRLLFKFIRSGPARLISHLETMKLIERALRRADTPLAYSQGFHPHPRLSFGQPLPLGYASNGDYFDALLIERVGEPMEKISPYFYGGVQLLSVQEIDFTAPALTKMISAYGYEIELPSVSPELKSLLTLFEKCASALSADLVPHLLSLDLSGSTFKMTVKIIDGRAPRPERMLADYGYNSHDIYNIHRESLIL